MLLFRRRNRRTKFQAAVADFPRTRVRGKLFGALGRHRATGATQHDEQSFPTEKRTPRLRRQKQNPSGLPCSGRLDAQQATPGKSWADAPLKSLFPLHASRIRGAKRKGLRSDNPRSLNFINKKSRRPRFPARRCVRQLKLFLDGRGKDRAGDVRCCLARVS